LERARKVIRQPSIPGDINRVAANDENRRIKPQARRAYSAAARQANNIEFLRAVVSSIVVFRDALPYLATNESIGAIPRFPPAAADALAIRVSRLAEQASNSTQRVN
jgi:hypothetical protein